MSDARAGESPAPSLPFSSSSSREEEPPSFTPSPSPSAAAAAAAAAADDDLNPNPSFSPDPSPSSPHPSSVDAALPSGMVALVRPSPSPATPPASAAAHSHSSARRLPPPCWSHEETEALIQSYRQKWYALRRGNLRASHWEEVADTVSRRCRHLYTPAGINQPKTAVQCRHKMEKLRKRYRSEKKRPHRTSWVHFRDMDSMEMGTTPAAVPAGGSTAVPRAKAPAATPAAYSDGNEEDESEEDDNDDDGSDEGEKKTIFGANTRSIHAVTSKTNGGSPEIGCLRFHIPKAVRSKVGTPRGEDRANAPQNPLKFKPFHHGGSNGYLKEFAGGPAGKPQPPVAEDTRKRMEERRRKEREGTMLEELVGAVRMLGDGFIRVEEMKMEMTMEMEKLRMEMELKRTEMILESQRCIVDAFVKGVAREKKKRPKIAPES